MRLNFLTRMYNESLVLLVNNGSKTPNVLKATNNLSMFTVVPEGFEFSYLMTIAVVSVIALIPYAVFFLFTCYCKALLQPKNVFKCNFAISAVIFFAGNLTHLLVLYYGFGSLCPDIYLLWWSSTGIIASVFLIELDRFLAIRYPLKYPVFMTDERSIVACIGTQFGSLILCIIVRLVSEETFSCTPICDGDLVINRKLFVFIVVVPYFVCYLLSLVCSLYVVKVLLKQTRRLNRIHSTTIQLSAFPTFPKSQRSASHFGHFDATPRMTSHEKSSEYNDVDFTKTDSNQSYAIPSLVLNLPDLVKADTKQEAIQVSKRFSERALSYPLEQDAPHRRIKFGTLREQIFKLKFSDKNDNSPTTHRATLNGGATTLDDIKRDMKSTIKTLSLLFLYLCMSSPSHVTAVLMYREMGTSSPSLRTYAFSFFHVSLFGHITYPYMWLFLDKMFADKIHKAWKNAWSRICNFSPGR